MRQRKNDGQRGAAAVEFALTVPIFLLFTSLIMTVGLSFLARLQLFNFATVVARSCAYDMSLRADQMNDCVTRLGSGLRGAVPVAFCSNVSLSVAPTSRIGSVGPSFNRRMTVLKVIATCERAPYLFSMNSGTNDAPGTMTVQSALPYFR